MDSVECMDIQTGTWKTMASLPQKVGGVAVGVLDGVLYAVGGYDGRNDTNLVER